MDSAVARRPAPTSLSLPSALGGTQQGGNAGIGKAGRGGGGAHADALNVGGMVQVWRPNTVTARSPPTAPAAPSAVHARALGRYGRAPRTLEAGWGVEGYRRGAKAQIGVGVKVEIGSFLAILVLITVVAFVAFVLFAFIALICVCVVVVVARVALVVLAVREALNAFSVLDALNALAVVAVFVVAVGQTVAA